MAGKRSAGLPVYRGRSGACEVFLVHSGGPFWSSKDAGAWSIPKGESDPMSAHATQPGGSLPRRPVLNRRGASCRWPPSRYRVARSSRPGQSKGTSIRMRSGATHSRSSGPRTRAIRGRGPGCVVHDRRGARPDHQGAARVLGATQPASRPERGRGDGRMRWRPEMPRGDLAPVAACAAGWRGDPGAGALMPQRGYSRRCGFKDRLSDSRKRREVSRQATPLNSAYRS